MVQNSSDVGYPDASDNQRRERFNEAVVVGRGVIQSRVLIAPQMLRDCILDRWKELGGIAETGERNRRWQHMQYSLLRAISEDLDVKVDFPKPL
jgi:hypothetical protein